MPHKSTLIQFLGAVVLIYAITILTQCRNNKSTAFSTPSTWIKIDYF